MTETEKHSRGRKPVSLGGPRPLSRQEIEALRQDRKDFHEKAKTLLAHVKPIGLSMAAPEPHTPAAAKPPLTSN